MEELRKRIINIQGKFKDLLDSPNAASAKRIKAEIQALEDDLQMRKNARTVEERVKRILQILAGDARDEQIMNHEHLDEVIDWFEDVQEDLRKL